VKIEFEVKDAAPLPAEGGYWLIKIPPGGLLQTSSKVEEGMAEDEYYYSGGVPRPIKRRLNGGDMIWAGVIGQTTDQNGAKKIWEEFFVGAEKEYKLWGMYAKDRNHNPQIGPKEKIRPDLIEN
jgi:hypothetical protein